MGGGGGWGLIQGSAMPKGLGRCVEGGKYAFDGVGVIQGRGGWWGWVWAKFLHIERKITSVVHSHPPSHYIRKHASG